MCGRPLWRKQNLDGEARRVADIYERVVWLNPTPPRDAGAEPLDTSDLLEDKMRLQA
jgi:hypothetical protein